MHHISHRLHSSYANFREPFFAAMPPDVRKVCGPSGNGALSLRGYAPAALKLDNFSQRQSSGAQPQINDHLLAEGLLPFRTSGGIAANQRSKFAKARMRLYS